MVQSKFFFLSLKSKQYFHPKLSWYHPKITYKNIVQKDMNKFIITNILLRHSIWNCFIYNFFSFEHQGSNNKNWIHSPDTLLNGHVVYLVKVRNCFFLRYQARRLCGFYGSTSVFNKDGKVLKEHANFNGGLLTWRLNTIQGDKRISMIFDDET